MRQEAGELRKSAPHLQPWPVSSLTMAGLVFSSLNPSLVGWPPRPQKRWQGIEGLGVRCAVIGVRSSFKKRVLSRSRRSHCDLGMLLLCTVQSSKA